VSNTKFTADYLEATATIARTLDRGQIDRMIEIIVDVRDRGGRLFFIGVGGGAGHAGHAVNDFRKICGIECYAPSDNVSELTARVNDDGWETSYVNWLGVSRLSKEDAIFVFSVGGGSVERNLSTNIVACVQRAKSLGARVVGVVGRDGGFTAQHADACVVVPTVDADTVTAHTEAFQAVVWHLMVSHPLLRRNQMTWESKAK
jgi:D-sedoheptulose 7-phosphate isomerase